MHNGFLLPELLRRRLGRRRTGQYCPQNHRRRGQLAPGYSSSHNLDKAYFFDADNGWVAAAANIPEIFRTEDGGNSWEVVSLPFSGFWKDILQQPVHRLYCRRHCQCGTGVANHRRGDTWEAIYTTYGILNAIARQEDETGARIWIGGFGEY